jgi:hypothetical protein
MAIRHWSEAVHSGVWKDAGWRHPSGLTVFQIQSKIGLESADRALHVCRAFLNACLEAANADDVLGRCSCPARAAEPIFQKFASNTGDLGLIVSNAPANCAAQVRCPNEFYYAEITARSVTNFAQG